MKIDDLRTAQKNFNSSLHKEKIVVGIDRLTILADAIRPRKTLYDLQTALEEKLEGSLDFSVSGISNFSFTMERCFDNGDRTNMIYFEVVHFGTLELVRLDFNPNTLKEYKAMDLWQQIILFLRLYSEKIHLSRFDLSFDIFNLPSIISVKHVKGGVSSQFYYGRASELETVYWGSRGSNVQVRLYDKNKERLQKKKFKDLDFETYPYWWRFEMQLRTKVINADMVSEVVDRLQNFGIYDYKKLGGNKAFTYIFFQDESMLPYIFENLTSNSIRVNKYRLRKQLRELDNEFSNKLIQALHSQSSKLARELQHFTDEFLGFK